MMQTPSAVADSQPHVWPLQSHPSSELGQVQVLLPDAYVASMKLQPADSVKVGFMCGSLPVPTYNPTDVTTVACSGGNGSEAALIPAAGLLSQRVAAPRYRLLPTETDLNMPPSNNFEGDPIFPVSASHEATGSCKLWAGNYLSQPLARKGETLAVNVLADYPGEDIDVVAPVDLLKQVFMVPYSKARVSLVVHRIGQTLILNSGPDECRDDRHGGKLPSQKETHAERSLFSKFVQHSTNGYSRHSASTADSDTRSSSASEFDFDEYDDRDGQQSGFHSRMSASRKGAKQHKVSSLGHYRRQGRCRESFETVQKKRFGAREEQQEADSFMQKERPAEGPQRGPSDGYLRVLFWQFQNLRMLLGSDLLVFSNEDHSAVSLHLLEIERQVTPLMWLDVWLDNMMANVPELAVCYHRNGVVQGYELLKTDDIFLLKGLADDGTTFFNPHVVQKNASTVLRFLQDNCKQDPGTYWLLRNAGEDFLQLFDLAIISKTCSAVAKKDPESCDGFPSGRGHGQQQYSLPLAMLLYRLTHRLSQSKDPAHRRKCAKLFGKCLEFMEEQEHLIIRASAHEHVARLILASFKEIGSVLTPLLLESGTEGEVNKAANQTVLKLPCSPPESSERDTSSASSGLGPHANEKIISSGRSNQPRRDMPPSSGLGPHAEKELNSAGCSVLRADPCPDGDVTSRGTMMTGCQVVAEGQSFAEPLEEKIVDQKGFSLVSHEKSGSGSPEAYVNAQEAGRTVLIEPNNALGFVSASSNAPKSFALADPVSARLAAVHHISQAIKALRWQRQLDAEVHVSIAESVLPKQPPIHHNQQQFSLCICGEPECVAICDFRDIRVGPQMDKTLWRLMLLLSEAYFALAQAYKDEGQLSRALKAAELSCLACGAMPQINENNVGLLAAKGMSSQNSILATMNEHFPTRSECKTSNPQRTTSSTQANLASAAKKVFRNHQQGSFWGQLWTLVGDVCVDIERSVGGSEATVVAEVHHDQESSQFEELTISQDVMKEVKRLTKKFDQLRGSSCEMCSLTSCSCQSDRASSGNSAASSCNSSNSFIKTSRYGRHIKQNKRTNSTRRQSNKICEEGSPTEGADFSSCGASESTLKASKDPTKPVGNRDLKLPKPNEAEVKIEPARVVGVESSSAPNLPATKTKKENRDLVDIFTVLRRPVTSDWEANLSAAVYSYDRALAVFKEHSEGSKDLELTLRKKGWGCNELGRRLLAVGKIKSAEVAFESAIAAFRDVKDFVNVVLVQCNLGHGQRAAAEALATKLSTWEECDFHPLFVQTVAEGKFLYGEALKFYGMARMELLRADGGKARESSIGGLWTEVHTQLAHTYLRLGMLLAREDKFFYSCRRRMNAECRSPGNHGEGEAILRVKGDSSSSTKDAITKAIEIYKSLGVLRAQEAAFAQHQLACHHRDSCQSCAIGVDVDDAVQKNKVVGTCSGFQRAKLHASLAELYWQKVLDFYRPETHPDMYLDILMDRSSVCLLMATSFHLNQMMEQALMLLLEARRVITTDPADCASDSTERSESMSSGKVQPSEREVQKLSQQVHMLLRTMLAWNKTSSSNTNMTKPGKRGDTDGNGEVNGGRLNDIGRLRKMYYMALKWESKPDLESLYRLWMG